MHVLSELFPGSFASKRLLNLEPVVHQLFCTCQQSLLIRIKHVCIVAFSSADKLEEVDVAVSTTFVDAFLIIVVSLEIIEKKELLLAQCAFNLELLS